MWDVSVPPAGCAWPAGRSEAQVHDRSNRRGQKDEATAAHGQGSRALAVGEPVRRRDLVFLGALATGLGLFFVGHDPPARTAPAPLLGNLLAVASSVTCGLLILGLRWLGREERGAGAAAAAVVMGNLMSFAACLPWALPVTSSRTADWIAIAYLGFFQNGVAYVFMTSGIPRVPALEASLLMYVEPALSPVWAWLVHGERPGPLSLCGGGLILLATAIRTVLDLRLSPPARPTTSRGRDGNVPQANTLAGSGPDDHSANDS